MLWVPLLSQRGVSQFNLIAVAWHIIVVQHLVKQLLLPVVDEGVEQVSIAYIARRQTVAVGMDVGNQLLQDSLTIALRHQSHFQSDSLCTLATRANQMGIGMIELTNEGSLDAVGTGFTHQLVPTVVMCCRHQRHRGVLCKACPSRAVVVPVAKALLQDITGILRMQIVHIALHLRLIAGNESLVTIILLIQERQGDECPTPLRRLQEGRSPRTFKDTQVGGYLGQGTIRKLSIGYLLHGLLYHRATIVIGH